MNEDPRVPYNPYHDLLVPSGHDSFARLFNAEVYFMAETYSKDETYKSLRRSAIEFIENQSRSPNFDALIPYLAMTYFDRFLMNSEIPLVLESRVANINLFLTSCLTVAWKLRIRTFELSRFLNERNLHFSAENVLAMELHICRHLDWRMRTLTPFSFIEFFIPFLNIPHDLPSPLRSVRQLIIKSQFDIAFTEFRPSVLAASAMLTVSSKMFPAQFRLFETHIITSEFINPLTDMVYKCNKMLAPLYKDPPSSVAPKQSDPIPIPLPGRQTSTAAKTRIGREDPGSSERKPAEQRVVPEEASTSVAREQSDPIPIPVPVRQTSTAAETQIRTTEELMFPFSPCTFTREEPAASEIYPEPEERHEHVQADSDELMNFDLGWIEAQADTERRVVAQAGRRAGCAAYIVRGLTGCSNFMQSCSIL